MPFVISNQIDNSNKGLFFAIISMLALQFFMESFRFLFFKANHLDYYCWNFIR